jgi:S-phase kinase-associated protein 1
MSVIKIFPSDNEETFVEVDEKVARMSQTVANMLDDIGADAPITLHNITSKTLSKVLEYCEYHVNDPVESTDSDDENENKTKEISPWDKQFCEIDQSNLFELILAANFLDIKPLLDVTCKTVANIIKGKTPEEIRKTFNIKNDFTPEEEEKVRKENEWCSEH